jgi:hypothetical protein
MGFTIWNPSLMRWLLNPFTLVVEIEENCLHGFTAVKAKWPNWNVMVLVMKNTARGRVVRPQPKS